jgi:hypothetical protein
MKSAQNAVIPTIYLRNGAAKAPPLHYMRFKRKRIRRREQREKGAAQ